MTTFQNSTHCPVVHLIDQQLITTSREIAEAFSKRHDDVLKRIAKLDCSEEFATRNFAASEYRDGSGKKNTEYQITRDGFTFLAMGFTGKRAAQFKEAYIAEFNRMEQQLREQQMAEREQLHISKMRFVVTLEGGDVSISQPLHPNDFVTSFEKLPALIEGMAFGPTTDQLERLMRVCSHRLVARAYDADAERRRAIKAEQALMDLRSTL